MQNITTVILAAGQSTRFKSNKSKIFHELAGLPIIEHVYKVAKQVSKNKIVFVCNKQNIKEIQNRFHDCKFVIQTHQNGTADAILLTKKLIKTRNVLILFGDVPLLSLNSIKKLINNFSINKSIGSMIAFVTNDPFGYGRIISKNNKVVSVIEEINTNSKEKFINLCNSGIMLCNKKLLFSYINQISNKNKKKEKYLPDIFNIFHNTGNSFTFITSSEKEMLGINTISDFHKIDKIYQEQLKDKMINRGVMILQPETVRLSYDTKIGKNSLIEPYVYIKTGVSIKRDVQIKSHTIIESSVIGKNTSVGPFARIRPFSILGKEVKVGNYVEIKNSNIGDNCSISHLSYIGDSVLGKNINIGAGTITCNYDGKIKNKTIIEDNVFIGSNSSLVAPLTIGKNSIIGAGSVITKNIPKNKLAVGRSKLKISSKILKK